MFHHRDGPPFIVAVPSRVSIIRLDPNNLAGQVPDVCLVIAKIVFAAELDAIPVAIPRLLVMHLVRPRLPDQCGSLVDFRWSRAPIAQMQRPDVAVPIWPAIGH